MTLSEIITKRLTSAGYSDKENKEGENPYFIVGKQNGKTLNVDLYYKDGRINGKSILDILIDGIRGDVIIKNDLYKLHAVINKSLLRVRGKKLFKASLTLVFEVELIQEAEL